MLRLPALLVFVTSIIMAVFYQKKGHKIKPDPFKKMPK
jgi:hypothetical protein